jgi:hypothetical protein
MQPILPQSSNNLAGNDTPATAFVAHPATLSPISSIFVGTRASFQHGACRANGPERSPNEADQQLIRDAVDTIVRARDLDRNHQVSEE